MQSGKCPFKTCPPQVHKQFCKWATNKAVISKPGCGTTHAASADARKEPEFGKSGGRLAFLNISWTSLLAVFTLKPLGTHGMARGSIYSIHLLLCTRIVRVQQAVHIDRHNCHILPQDSLIPVSIPLIGNPCLPRTFSKHSLHSRDQYMSIACTSVPHATYLACNLPLEGTWVLAALCCW